MRRQEKNNHKRSLYFSNSLIVSLLVLAIIIIIILIFNENKLYLILFTITLFIDFIYIGLIRGILDFRKLAGYKLTENIIQLTILVIFFIIFSTIDFRSAVIFYFISAIISLLAFEILWPITINLDLSIQEVKSFYLSAGVVLQNMIFDVEKRVPYRKVMKRAIDQVKKAGAKGVKLVMGGRLDGVEIARQETLTWGRVPLNTLRADIDYARGAAHTTYGLVGIKVWIYKGEVLKEKASEKNN